MNNIPGWILLQAMKSMMETNPLTQELGLIKQTLTLKPSAQNIKMRLQARDPIGKQFFK